MRRFYEVLKHPSTKAQKAVQRKDAIKEYHRQMVEVRKR